MTDKVVLRDVMAGDLPVFFEHQLDPTATQMGRLPIQQQGFIHGALDQNFSR